MEKYKWFYFLSHVFPITILCGYAFHMPYLFLGIFLSILTFFTILDFFVTRDDSYSFDEVLTTVENDGRLSAWIYQIETGSYLLLHLIALICGVYFVQYEQPFIGWFLYALPLGFSSGLMINLCHEYMHKNNLTEKIIARFYLSLIFFNIFENDHLYNHHNEEVTCTDKDPAFAKLNQSLYAYTCYLFYHNFLISMDIQRKMLEKKGYSFYNIFRNTLLKWYLFSFLLFALVGIFIGMKAFCLLITQMLVSYLLFGSTTYNQHYGLYRRIKEDGTPESFTYMNVWTSDHFMTGRCYINLSHHGHHHLFNLCRYPHLKVIRLGPLLPYGYNAVIFISLFPKLWYKIMNPLVEKVFILRDQYEKEGKL